MNNLSKVLVFKIVGTLLLWCVPLLLFPAALLESLGFPEQDTYMFVRLLGWAYLALCVGYYFALRAALKNKRLMGPIWVGIVSNGGASVLLACYGFTGTWSQSGVVFQFVTWSSVGATALITLGLYIYGVKGSNPIAGY
ncbi:MAG: hypothetical protein KTR16_03845 [Acidiferrobacterales bacterium]|nr:hypothetical protein [Acidiferrobacterales bacterium]